MTGDPPASGSDFAQLAEYIAGIIRQIPQNVRSYPAVQQALREILGEATVTKEMKPTPFLEARGTVLVPGLPSFNSETQAS